MIFKLLIPLGIVLLLTSCKTLVETNVKLSELQKLDSNTTRYLVSDLYMQVTSCGDFEDSRKESDDVIKSKQTIPSIFKKAKYIECFEKEFESFTHFQIPIVLTNGNNIDKNHINIISNSVNLLSVSIPQSVKNGIDRVKENSFGMTDLDLAVQIHLDNDTKKKIHFNALSTYINEKPFVYESLTISSGYTMDIKLSDVSVDNALENGSSNVLIYNQ